MPRMLYFSALVAFAVAGCASCEAGPANRVSLPRPQLAPHSSLDDAVGGVQGDRWWLAYGDDQLNGLVAEALRTAPSLAAAAQRLGAVAPTRARKPVGKPSSRLEPLDLWRRDRAVLAASTSEDEVARLERAQAQLLLTTGVVSAYGELWRLSTDRDAAQNLAGLHAQATSAERDVTAALASDLEAARRRLAVLVWANPDRIPELRPPSAGRANFQLLNGRVEQLVSRRPDLQAARWRAAMAEARLAATRVSVIPRLGLSAFLGRHALGLNHFVSSGSDIGQTGLGLWSPGLDDDDPGATLDAPLLDRDAAASAYEQALVGALRNVAHATASERVLDLRLNDARSGLIQAEAASRAIRARYADGLAPKAALLAAEAALVARRNRVAGLQARGLVADATLIGALGGGIAAPPR